MSDVQTFTEGQPSAPVDTPAAPPPAAPAPTEQTPAAPPADNRDRPALNKSPSQQIRDAARALANRRRELRAQAAGEAQPPAAPAADQSPSQEVEAAQPEADPGVPTEADPAVTPPPIEPPRAWKKEYKAAFDALPREVQEQVAESERAREADFRNRQNEVAERAKAFDVELQQMQQTRQQYEQGLGQALQLTLNSNEFSDVRSMDDVEAMARDDWPRWVRYQTHQQKVQMLQGQLQEVKQQNYQEQVGQWSRFAEEQDHQFAEKFPDAKTLKDAAVSYLKDQGFGHEEIARYWNSAAWRDARMQGVILDAVRYQQAKTKADAAKKAPVPEVQKPGTSAPKINAFSAQIAELEAKGGLSLKEATRLSQLRRLNTAKK